MRPPSDDYLARVATVESLGGFVKQNPLECAKMFRILKQNPPRTFVEIGSHYGGTLYVFAGACKIGANIVCIDDGKRAKGRHCLRRVVRTLTEEGYKVTWIRGSSHDDDTVRAATDLCGIRSVDAMFVDGDHSELGVLDDYRDYRGLIKAGGLMAFHDINTRGTGCRVYKAWPKIKRGQTSYEIDGGTCTHLGSLQVVKPRKLGIGVIVAP